jgi:hypothetical protein
MTYNYQVDYGDGYENAYPDSSLHDPSCSNPDCPGCWDMNDFEVWFESIEDHDDGRIEKARVLFGNQVLEERDFQKN